MVGGTIVGRIHDRQLRRHRLRLHLARRCDEPRAACRRSCQRERDGHVRARRDRSVVVSVLGGHDSIRAMMRSCRAPRRDESARAFRWVFVVAAIVAISTTSGSAAANGRYPRSNQLLIDPGNPDHLVTRATFGILNSLDDGRTWEWVCEQAIGYMGTEDPAIALGSEGSIFAVSTRGLTVTHDGGCSWSRHSDRLGIDVTVDRANRHHALAAERALVGSTLTTALLETTDDGATWNDIGAMFEPRFLLETVDIAPSNPTRVYVTGAFSDTNLSVALRSDDGGRTFTSFMLNLPSGE